MSNFVKMRGFFLFILLLINCTVSKGQIYKYIGLEDGLNNLSKKTDGGICGF